MIACSPALTPARERLSRVTGIVLALQLTATFVAVAANLPSPFDAGTDAGDGWAVRGTAISAPLALLVALGLAAAMVQTRHGNWPLRGVWLAAAVGVTLLAGAAAALVAGPTPEVSGAVAVLGSAFGLVLAVALLVGAVGAWREARAAAAARS